MIMSAHPLPPPTEDDPFMTEQGTKAHEYLVKYAASGQTLPWQETLRQGMATGHLFIIEMLARVYAFASYAVENDDVANYLGYAEVVIYQIYSHHDFEERKVFPELEKASGMKTELDHNVDQHRAFTQPLHVSWVYLRRCREALNVGSSPVPEPSDEINSLDVKALSNLDPNLPFDPKQFREYMKSYVPVLLEHLVDELDTLGPKMTEKCGKQKMEAVDKMVTKHLASYDPTWFLCSAYASVSGDKVKKTIPVPFIVRKFLIPFIWAPKYRGFWYYCPFPQNLTFSGSA